ncbi:SDR family NAD(P)-dependent oxidoreductase [Streptomyces sp. NPDC005227]|uniref:SDR family NAD(P)-dependent oxidoreductase n=1 Tax=unclassified Streptomyces TaxID=2593676 RepID=UPI00367D1393
MATRRKADETMRMAQRGHGSVVTVSSSAAPMPAPVGGAYAASKAGVEILTRY